MREKKFNAIASSFFSAFDGKLNWKQSFLPALILTRGFRKAVNYQDYKLAFWDTGFLDRCQCSQCVPSFDLRRKTAAGSVSTI